MNLKKILLQGGGVGVLDIVWGNALVTSFHYYMHH